MRFSPAIVFILIMASCRIPHQLQGDYVFPYGNGGNIDLVFHPGGDFDYLGDYDSILDSAHGKYFSGNDSLFLVYDTMDYPRWRYNVFDLPDSLQNKSCWFFRLHEYGRRPVANAWVKIVDSNHRTLDSARSDLSGHALADKLPTGAKPAHIVVSADSFEVVSIAVDSLKNHYVNIVMMRPGPCYFPPGVPVGYKARCSGKTIFIEGPVPDYAMYQSKTGTLRKAKFELTPRKPEFLRGE